MELSHPLNYIVKHRDFYNFDVKDSILNINTPEDVAEAERMSARIEKKRNILVIMMGFTASGKTTLALKLGKNLKAEVYHSAATRRNLNFKVDKEEAADRFFDLERNERIEMDKIVYGENLKYAIESLKKKQDVILDAGHFFKKQRENIYKKTAKYNPEIFIIRTVCREEQIRERLSQRYNNFGKTPFDETPSIRAYESCKTATEFPDGSDILPSGENPNILEVNTLTGEIFVKQKGKSEEALNKVISAIKSC